MGSEMNEHLVVKSEDSKDYPLDNQDFGRIGQAIRDLQKVIAVLDACDRPLECALLQRCVDMLDGD